MCANGPAYLDRVKAVVGCGSAVAEGCEWAAAAAGHRPDVENCPNPLVPEPDQYCRRATTRKHAVLLLKDWYHLQSAHIIITKGVTHQH